MAILIKKQRQINVPEKIMICISFFLRVRRVRAVISKLAGGGGATLVIFFFYETICRD